MSNKEIIEHRFELLSDKAWQIVTAETKKEREQAFEKFDEAFEDLKETMLYIGDREEELATLYRIDDLAKFYHER